MTITEQIRRERMEYLGSSDLEVIAGLSPFRSERDVQLSKQGLGPPLDNEAIRMGDLMEEPLLLWAEQELGLEIVRGGTLGTYREGILGANLDGYCLNAISLGPEFEGPMVVECKFTNSTKGWGMEWTDEVPPRVTVQVHGQMLCAKVARCLVIVLMPVYGRTKICFYVVEYDPRIGGPLQEKAREWWDTYILSDNTAPGTVHKTPSAGAMEIPRQEGKRIQVGGDLLGYIEAAKEEEKRAKAAVKEQMDQLKEQMGDAEIAEFSGTDKEFTYFEKTRTTYGVGPKYENKCNVCGVGHKDTTYRDPRFRKARQ